MSVPSFAWALEQGKEHRLAPPDRLVLLYLADMANGERECWPGQGTIAAYTGLAIRTIRDCIERLAKLGLISLGWRGKGRSYRINRPLAEAEHRQQPPVKKAKHRQEMPVSNGDNSQKHRQELPAKASDTGSSRHSHRQLTAETPAPAADYPLKIQEKTQEARDERARPTQDFQSFSGRKAEPDEPEPTPAEVEANRRRQMAELARTSPAIAAAVGGLGSALSGKAMPLGRRPALEPREQIAALQPAKELPAADPRLAGAIAAARKALAERTRQLVPA